jgi:hypothetical protein
MTRRLHESSLFFHSKGEPWLIMISMR